MRMSHIYSIFMVRCAVQQSDFRPEHFLFFSHFSSARQQIRIVPSALIVRKRFINVWSEPHRARFVFVISPEYNSDDGDVMGLVQRVA